MNAKKLPLYVIKHDVSDCWHHFVVYFKEVGRINNYLQVLVRLCAYLPYDDIFT